MRSRLLVVGLGLGAAGAFGGQAAVDRFHQTDAALERAYLQGYAKAAEVDAPKAQYADVDQCFAFARAAHGFNTPEYHAYGNGCEKGLTGEPPTAKLYIEVNKGD